MRYKLEYINFNFVFDFLYIQNEFFESYFANELTIDRSFYQTIFISDKTLLLMF